LQYRSFPTIPDLKISTLGFGCMRLPTIGSDQSRIDEALATRLIRSAIDGGVNFVDTAHPYHGGQSELVVGRALKDGYRARVQLATKLPTWLVKSASDWERLLDAQLAKLDTDTIDVYFLHSLAADSWNTVVRLKGLKALERARADGRIRHIGFSFHGSLESFKTIIDSYDWACCLIQYNFVDQEFQAGTMGLRYAASKRIGIAVMEPLRGGALATNVPEQVQAIWARYPVPRTPAEWALRWVWNHPEVTTVLSGMNAESQLQENLAVAESARAGSMSAAELALIAEAREHFRSRTKVSCTTCGYCEPCPNGVAISDVFSMYNTSVVFDSRDFMASWYRNLFVNSGRGADACIACGECEPKCPQAVPIVDKLSEAHTHLTAGGPRSR
jgi:predicted aldo/keto reductase-like oxidoreductase